jgi:phosphate-selective porin OprO/OprP
MQISTIGRAVTALLLSLSLLTALGVAAADEVRGGDVEVKGASAGKTGSGLSVNEEILLILRQEGDISESRYQELHAKEMAERKAAEEKKEKGYTVGYKHALEVKRNDGRVKIKLGGRIQGDFMSIWSDPQLEVAAGRSDGTGVEFRRARLYMSGTLWDRVVFKAQYDFAGDSESDAASFKDVYIGVKGLGPVGTVLVGHMKEPWSLEEMTSSKYITFMERALPSVFDSERNFGLLAKNSHLDDRITWALGIFAPTNNKGFSFNEDTRFNVSGRLTGLPLYADEGRHLVHLGASYSYQYREETELDFSARPEAHLAPKYIASNDLIIDGDNLVNVEAAWVFGPLSLQGEWKGFWSKQNSNGNWAFNQGAYAQASYFLTGEHRRYKKSAAVFDRILPNENFNPMKGGWGAWEIAARYSYLNANGGSFDGGEEQNVTVGLNWYLYSNLRLMLNYVYADVKETGAGTDLAGVSGHAHILQTRAAIEF